MMHSEGYSDTTLNSFRPSFFFFWVHLPGPCPYSKAGSIYLVKYSNRHVFICSDVSLQSQTNLKDRCYSKKLILDYRMRICSLHTSNWLISMISFQGAAKGRRWITEDWAEKRAEYLLPWILPWSVKWDSQDNIFTSRASGGFHLSPWVCITYR